MRKVFFLIAFLFSVVCYADSPLGDTDHFIQQSEMVSSLDECIDVPETVQRIEAQEVAIFNIGYIEVISGTEKSYEFAAITLFAELPAVLSNINLTALNNPSSSLRNEVETKLSGALQNNQHTNYGYPLTANKVGRVL